MPDPVTVILPYSTQALRAESHVCTDRCQISYRVVDAGVTALMHELPGGFGNVLRMDPLLSRDVLLRLICGHHGNQLR